MARSLDHIIIKAMERLKMAAEIDEHCNVICEIARGLTEFNVNL